jgi:hypothetical protein
VNYLILWKRTMPDGKVAGDWCVRGTTEEVQAEVAAIKAAVARPVGLMQCELLSLHVFEVKEGGGLR